MNASHGPLSPEQIQFFKDEGYVIARGLIEPVFLESWREQFWRHLEEDPRDPDAWKKRPYVLENFAFQPEHARMEHLTAIRAAVQQLGGGRFVGGSTQLLTHWPAPDTAWSYPQAGHVDAYPPQFWFPFMLGVTTNMFDCDPMGGAFIYWPKSHLATWRYFRQHPELIDGRFRFEHGFDWGKPNVFCDLAPEPPRQFTAAAGDVVFWHAYLVHTGSRNVRRHPRVGMFLRYQHEDQEQIKHEVPEDLWKYWAI